MIMNSVPVFDVFISRGRFSNCSPGQLDTAAFLPLEPVLPRVIMMGGDTLMMMRLGSCLIVLLG